MLSRKANNESIFEYLNLFFRSLLFATISLGIIFSYSIMCIFLYFTPLTFRYKIIANFLKFKMLAFSKICRVNYEIQGLENIPKDHAAIVMCKHQSTWETYFLVTIFREPAVIVKRELLWIPFFGWALGSSKPISINRSDKKNSMQQVIEKGKAALNARRFVLLFPEGTRVPYGQVGQYKLGGARLGTASGYPIIPVAHDAGAIWPRRKFIKRPGTIHVAIGKPIETVGRTPEAVLAETKQWIEETIQQFNRVNI